MLHRVVQNEGSGNCLFYAIAQGIVHKRRFYADYVALGKELRKIAVSNMKIMKDYDETYKMLLSAMYPCGKPDGDNSEDYVKWMSKNSSWGGDLELKALEKYIHSIGISGIRIYYADVSKGIQQSMALIHGFGTRVRKKKYNVVKLILHHACTGGTHYEYVYKMKNIKKQTSDVVSSY